MAPTPSWGKSSKYLENMSLDEERGGDSFLEANKSLNSKEI